MQKRVNVITVANRLELDTGVESRSPIDLEYVLCLMISMQCLDTNSFLAL